MTVDELYDQIKIALVCGDLDGSEEVVVLNDNSDGDFVWGAWMGGIVELTDYQEGRQHGLVIGYSNRPLWGFRDPQEFSFQPRKD